MSVEICDELRQNFVDFSYEANSQRAFPSALDGLKPGQRACLWEFYNKGFASNKPHVKSAKVSGGVIASWWPHGDVAVYETFARMSQPWINNIPEVDWHGNNGSQVAGPDPANQRYTEARLSKASEDGFFTDIDKEAVNMIANFTEDDEWPEVFPSIFPRLFVNGSQGIGMTIANTWLPGNLNEFYDKVKSYIATKTVDCSGIYPDFPTGGVIINKDELQEIYETGKGRCVLRAKAEIKENNILITELPYQVYAEELIDEIKALVNNEQLQGIKDIYNKSDKTRLLIEIECEGKPKHVLNQLFEMTDLQKTFSANQYAMITKVPELLNLQQYITAYVNHNLECIRRAHVFDLKKIEARYEIVIGLLKALEDIDNIIKLIKESESAEAAKLALIEKYEFTENQAKAILDMRLAKLAHLEAVELNNEKANLDAEASKHQVALGSQDVMDQEFLTKLEIFVKKYGYARRTELTNVKITKAEKEIVAVEPEKCVVVMTANGYIKRIPAIDFKEQKRNGKGVKTQADITSCVIRTNTIDNLLVFTSFGKVYKLLVDDIPEGTNTTTGQPIGALVPLEPGEVASTIYSIYRDSEAKYIFFATKQGIVKKVALTEFEKMRKKAGTQAIKLHDDDALASVAVINEEPIIIISNQGQAIKIDSKTIGTSGKAAVGIKGMGLNPNDYVIAALAIRHDTDQLAVFFDKGQGKRIELSEFAIQNRGGKGLKVGKTGNNVSCATLVEDSDSLLVTGTTNSICISASDLPIASRVAVGNLIIKNDTVTSVTKI